MTESAGQMCSVPDLALIPDGSINCFLIDPPWPYGNQSTRGNTDSVYDTMTMEDIHALPVKRLGADASHCFVWTTVGFHRQAYELLDTWGYEDKGYYVWTKPEMGMGNYFRVSHETMLLGVRKNLRFKDRGILSWGNFYSRKRGHSVKPAPVRTMIERVSDGPRLELFARTIHQEWIPWGNEIPREVFEHRINSHFI